MMHAREDRRDSLFDLLSDHIHDGVTIPGVCESLGCSQRQAYQAVRDLRHFLRDDSINVTCNPDRDTPRGPWVYMLIASFSQAGAWPGRREDFLQAELETMHAFACSMVNETDGRTAEGRRAPDLAEVPRPTA